MDNHFGKYKFKSGNIPFTLFGKFDDKTDVLFKDSTDNFKTNYEILHKTKFERNVEAFYDDLIKSPSQCSRGNNFYIFNQTLTFSVLLVIFLL